MAELTFEQKTFIVQGLARFLSPSEVVEAVKEEFEVEGKPLEVSRQQVRHYNPLQSRDVAPEWRALFESTREQFLSDSQAVPVAHQAYRLALLQRLIDKAGKNTVLKARLLEQAAKEIGGMFTNRRELTGADGAPLAPTATLDLSRLSTAELDDLERLVAKTTATAEPSSSANAGPDPPREGQA